MSPQFHTVESHEAMIPIVLDDVITDYAAGNLSPAKHALMACVVEMNPKVAKRTAFETDVAASLMTEIQDVPLTSFFLEEALTKLPYHSPVLKAADDASHERLAPQPLRDLLDGKGLRDIRWKSFIPGVAVHDVLGDRRTRYGDRLYLLRIRGGMPMPEHSHVGEEWTLILQGSYRSEGNTYVRGDCHLVDGAKLHAPKVNPGEDCVCLVMTQGPLKMRKWLTKLVQKIAGI